MTKQIILIAGPTASGKSKLAISLAKKLGGEIINADSMQVYKEFEILTSRPNKKDLKKINHHLYGIKSVKENFSVGDWIKLLKKKIIYCEKKNLIPIIVGGTGLYFNAIIKGLSRIPDINKKIRHSVRGLHQKIGAEKFYKKLIKLDPSAKDRILVSDTQRVLRAYEVKLSTKKSIFEWAKNTRSDFLNYEIKKIFIDIPKPHLLENITNRTEKMFKKKCVVEVQKFLKLNISKSLSANKIIGVNEIDNYLKGLSSLSSTKEQISVKTRQYAKRQKTWSRGHMNNWNKLYSKDFSVLLKKTLKVVS